MADAFASVWQFYCEKFPGIILTPQAEGGPVRFLAGVGTVRNEAQATEILRAIDEGRLEDVRCVRRPGDAPPTKRIVGRPAVASTG